MTEAHCPQLAQLPVNETAGRRRAILPPQVSPLRTTADRVPGPSVLAAAEAPSQSWTCCSARRRGQSSGSLDEARSGGADIWGNRLNSFGSALCRSAERPGESGPMPTLNARGPRLTTVRTCQSHARTTTDLSTIHVYRHTARLDTLQPLENLQLCIKADWQRLHDAHATTYCVVPAVNVTAPTCPPTEKVCLLCVPAHLHKRAG